MQWSKLFIPTLREDPANVEAPSHKLLLRGGYIRQLTAGVYSLLPLAQRSRRKIENIIREEMDAIGAQEFLLGCLQPIELWDESGRTALVADVMFRFKDRKGSSLALGVTHEEVFTSIARDGLSTYRQLPQMWYQFQTKFRDEARPKAGLLRVREFTMKDSYSFDIDEAGLKKSFELHAEAYRKIFTRCGVPFREVQADSGAMGGSTSTEFMVLTNSGEDTLLLCSACDYAANVERAQSRESAREQSYKNSVGETAAIRELHTPGIRTIEALANFEGGGVATSQIKTLVFVADENIVLALVRGDQELNETKLQSALQAKSLRQAEEREIVTALGAKPGSLGACNISSSEHKHVHKIVADPRLKGRTSMLTGANKDDYHYVNVDVERDIKVDHWHDLHTVRDGEDCIKCGAKMSIAKGLEIGHIFQLGTFYSDSMRANVLSAESQRIPLQMGSYGIGVERLLAAVAEVTCDDSGLNWPLAIAPYAVVIVPVNAKSEEQTAVATQLYEELKARNIECLIDDRDERAGVKFNDSELVGIPYRITVGKKVAEGKVELFTRFNKKVEEVMIATMADKLISLCSSAQSQTSH